MRTYVVTGSSRGIGHALVRQLLDGGNRVLAACRSPADANALGIIAERLPDRLSVHALDVTDETSVAAFAHECRGVRIDTLINNAGILGGHDQGFDSVDYDEWRRVIETNLFGPVRVSQALQPNLRLSSNPIIATISSELGSSVWPTGGLYLYASSKGGLNRVIQMMAIDLKPQGFRVIAIHPGLVRTDMAGELGQIEPEESASGIVDVLEKLGPEETGKFFRWNGTIHSW